MNSIGGFYRYPKEKRVADVLKTLALRTMLIDAHVKHKFMLKAEIISSCKMLSTAPAFLCHTDAIMYHRMSLLFLVLHISWLVDPRKFRTFVQTQLFKLNIFDIVDSFSWIFAIKKRLTMKQRNERDCFNKQQTRFQTSFVSILFVCLILIYCIRNQQVLKLSPKYLILR